MRNRQNILSLLPGKRRKYMIVGTHVLVIGSVTAVVFLTLYPFTFEAFDRLFQLHHYVSGFKVGGYTRCCTHLALLEPLANILLFLPVGFGLTGVFFRKTATWPRTFVLVLALSLGLSIVVEFLQVFQPWRSASLTDVFMNSAGGSLGFLGFRLAAHWYRTLMPG